MNIGKYTNLETGVGYYNRFSKMGFTWPWNIARGQGLSSWFFYRWRFKDPMQHSYEAMGIRVFGFERVILIRWINIPPLPGGLKKKIVSGVDELKIKEM